MGLFDIFKKKGREFDGDEYLNEDYEGYDGYGAEPQYGNSGMDGQFPSYDYYDDETYIKTLRRSEFGKWSQYDIVLDSRNYNWDNMIEWADYMVEADYESVQEVKTGTPPQSEDDVTSAFHENGDRCTGLSELQEEKSILSIAGISRSLNAPMKIVWFNDTNRMKLFTLVDDELLIEKYTETAIRRTYGTEYEFKLGRPLS